MIEDFYKTIYFVTASTASDEMGGSTITYKKGQSFQGLISSRGGSEKVVGDQLGFLNEVFYLSVPLTVSISKNDLLLIPATTYAPKKIVRVTSNAIEAPDKSLQNYWKLYTAESYNVGYDIEAV